MRERCAECQRPLDPGDPFSADCPRCAGKVEPLARAVLEASGGRATALECYEFAKAVAAREAADRAHEEAIKAAFLEGVRAPCAALTFLGLRGET